MYNWSLTLSSVNDFDLIKEALQREEMQDRPKNFVFRLFGNSESRYCACPANLNCNSSSGHVERKAMEESAEFQPKDSAQSRFWKI